MVIILFNPSSLLYLVRSKSLIITSMMISSIDKELIHYKIIYGQLFVNIRISLINNM